MSGDCRDVFGQPILDTAVPFRPNPRRAPSRQFLPGPRGAARLMRTRMLAQIGGPPVAPFPDAAIDIKFELRGAECRRDPSVTAAHLRKTGTKFGLLEGLRLQGEGFYVLHYHPLALFLAAFNHATVKRNPQEFRAMITGYLNGWLTNSVRVSDEELIEYYRKAPQRHLSELIRHGTHTSAERVD